MVFLDYASTNPWPKYKCSEYTGLKNANANYAFGEKQLMQECERRVKTAIGANGGKVVFGGTASQLIENLFASRVTNDAMIISSVYEHDAVARFANQMDYIDGIKETIQNPYFSYQLIVCLMGVNNVTGQVMPIEEIGRLCKEHGAFFICDMTAMIGHAPIPANIDDWCDCAFWSGHKIGTELGIGAIWLSREFNDWLGDFKLHGTPNVAGALAIADATEDAIEKMFDEEMYNYELYALLEKTLKESGIEYDDVNGMCPKDACTSAINAIRLNGINARALQFYLASKQVYVGLGQSSCAEENDNRVLNAFGLSDKEASEVVRISFGENSKPEDVTTFVKYVKEFKEKYL